MPRVMLDPSLLVSQRSFSIVEPIVRAEAERFVVPATFLDAVRESEVDSPVLEFFGAPKMYPFQAEAFTNKVRAATERLEPWRAEPWLGEAKEYRGLILPEGNPQLFDILREEWSFMHEQSWIASRARGTFDAFIQGGAVAMELGRNQLDSLVVKTLANTGHPVPDVLSSRHRFRAAAKWVAAGGPEWTAFFNPALAGALGTLGLAYFLLIDP